MTGMAIGAAVLPVGMSRRRKAIAYVVFATLAFIPDFSIPGWGHYRYRISHSIFVNGAMIAVALLGLCLLRKLKGIGPSRRLLVAGTAAWCSHMLLDSMYNHGLGIRIYWPFSSASLVLTVPWFSTLEYSPPPMNMHTLRVFAIELAFYLPVLALVLAGRHVWNTRAGSANGD